MELLPLIVAAVAAGAILLIFIGLAGSSPVDPVQARLTQLGSMQAKNLEELELQQPFIERTLRPLVDRLSGSVSRVASTSFTADDREAPRARRQPRRPARRRLARHQGHRRDRRRRSSSFLLFVVLGVRSSFPVPLNFLLVPRRRPVRLHDPGVLAGRPGPKRQKRDPAHDPGRARPADDLRPGRPRLRRRARQGRREAQGPADRRVPPGAGRGPRRQGAARGAARHRPAHRGPGRSPTSSARSSRPSSSACRSRRCSRSSPSSSASSAASAPRSRRPRRRSRCCSRSSGASSRRCSSSSSGRRSS